MGVYIKGMAMPKSCRECPFRRETYLLTRQLCMANNDKAICSGLDTVDKSCPLVPVQTHGRLIDCDSVLYGLAHKLGIRSLDYLNAQEKAIVSWFRNAPTVIEAE